jgi:hypothetical protein
MRDRSDLDDPMWPTADASGGVPQAPAVPAVPEPPDVARGPDDADARPRGPQLGPLRITPTRVFLAIALVGGLGFLAWATFVRDQLQVPLMASGLAICGLVFAAIAVLSVGAVVRAGHEGRDKRAVLTAFLGGLVAVGAFLCLAGAVIMGMIWSTTD